jgi:hypothetical protein
MGLPLHRDTKYDQDIGVYNPTKELCWNFEGDIALLGACQ